MIALQRKLVVPIVFAIWTITLALSIHGLTALPWLIDSYDRLASDQPGVVPAGICTAYRYAYPFALLPVAAIVFYGTWLLRSREANLTGVIWFAAGSISIAATWHVWTLLVERSFFLLLIPA